MIQVVVSWDVTPYKDVVEYQHFGGPCCPHLQHEVKMEATWPFKMLVSFHIITQCYNPEDHNLNFVTDMINIIISLA
jgi:hypothetical protein